MFQKISTLFLICLVSIAFGDVIIATADTDKKILQINLKYNDLTAEEYVQAVSPLAGDIAAVDGLLWKVWIINEQTQEAGGIHLFEDEASLNAHLGGPIVAQLTSHPNLSDFDVKQFDIMEEPTTITRGPIGENTVVGKQSTYSKILQINLKYNDLTAEEYIQTVSPLAGDIAAVDGLLWKVWIINEQTQEAGGIHLFENETSLNAHLGGPIVAQLTSHPNLSDFDVKQFDVMAEPTGITRGPIGKKEIEDFSNVFFMSLSSGLNMISLPLKPQAPYTARSFAEELSATMVIKFDEARQRFAGFTLDAPDNGFPIEGGKGYIVNVPSSQTVAFTGAAWTNQPPAEAAPPLPVEAPDKTWAFVVSGQIHAVRNFDTSSTMDYLVTVRNTRTNAIATDQIRSGYFAATFADLSRQSVVEVGDQLEVTVMDGEGEQISDRIQITVTPETIRHAFVPIEFTGVFKPRRNLLLQNYPNPFNPETWIPYQLQDASAVVIQIYDARGGLVRTLNFGQREAGFYQSRSKAAYWDGKNDAGEPVASGVYFYRLSAKDFSATRRMLIVK